MKNKKNILLLIFCTASSLFAGGLELRVVVSGKLLLGVAYRHYFDPNTSLRLGVTSSFNGSPVGFSAHVFQDLKPEDKWTPLFGLGVDGFIFQQQHQVKKSLMPSASAGFSYRPENFITHQVEVDLLYIRNAGKIKPLGMGYSAINCSL